MNATSQPTNLDPSRPTRVLILGGSSEATALARALAGRVDIATILSLAGRTTAPLAQPVAMRTGGFGGIDGLVSYLRREEIDVLIDATHPFAAQMAQQAREAARLATCRHLKVSRPAWAPQPGDSWREVATMDAAVAAIGVAPRRVFLTVGSLQLKPFVQAPQHRYLIRTIDPVSDVNEFADARFIEGRGPFDAAAEERLMHDHRIEVLVTKNSGGDASAAKLVAARRLGLPVILLERPNAGLPSITKAEAISAIEAHPTSTLRGV